MTKWAEEVEAQDSRAYSLVLADFLDFTEENEILIWIIVHLDLNNMSNGPGYVTQYGKA